MKITALAAPPSDLGEGPLWDADNRTIYWVDSLGPRIYRQHEDSAACEAFDLAGKSIGSLALCRQGGLLLAMDQGIYLYDPGCERLETIGLPLEGENTLFGASMSMRASICASTESGTCTAIWSPSKSAL